MNIFVCATAARNSGALMIVRQFLSSLPTYINENKYFIFVAKDIEFPKLEGISYIPVSTEKWIDRIKWDQSGLKKWQKKHNIDPDLIISFQNTGVNNKDVPQLIYYHQLLSLVDYQWNPFRRKERIFFLYKMVYPFFVRKYINKSSEFVVQTPFVKDCFIKKFKVNPEQVHIIKPDIGEIDLTQVQNKIFENDYIHFVYPATPLIYKNHKDIVLALLKIKEMNQEFYSKIRIHFTFNRNDERELYALITENDLEENFIYEGVLPHDELLSLYKSVNALLYPSYIETLGLPLLESAAFGLPIVVSDLPYARDAIGCYEGANFIELHNIKHWADAMLRLCRCPIRYSPLLPSNKSNWGMFFSLIYKMINSK